MIRGLYTSGYGMLTLNRKMDVVSNNLANVNTNGFKKDGVVFEEFSDVLAKRIYDYGNRPVNSAQDIGYMALYNDIAEVYTDYTQGSLENTNLNTDFAINGDDSAFFAVAVQDGAGNYREFYTRDGAFKLDDQGRLVTRDGFMVMGENGAIFLEGDSFNVNSNGEIYQDDMYIDTLRVRKFDNPETLRKFGMNLVTVTEDTVEGEFEGTVLQGYIERSNVDSIKEMVDMITILRSYEANQKMIQYQDSTLDKAVNDVGRV
jgi:flagellar basal-body rod protein FlgG